MNYSERFIKRNGQACTVTSRSPTIASKCIISPSTKGGWRISDRTDYWDGKIPPDINLTPGETVSVGNKELIVMSTNLESGVTMFMGIRSNASLNWQQQTPSVDPDYNVIMVWNTVSADVPAYGQLITAQLRQTDPGLLPNAKYLFFVPSPYNIGQMDRVIMSGQNTVSCQVDALDNIILDGIIRLQCSEDTRL